MAKKTYPPPYSWSIVIKNNSLVTTNEAFPASGYNAFYLDL
ncbi:MAG: hypothetical protein ABI415_05420 [Flavitalea sp.]